MAKTLKTGDVKRIDRNRFYAAEHAWAIVALDGTYGFGRSTRRSARYGKRSYQRIAKIIKRTPKYVFVEVSK